MRTHNLTFEVPLSTADLLAVILIFSDIMGLREHQGFELDHIRKGRNICVRSFRLHSGRQLLQGSR